MDRKRMANEYLINLYHVQTPLYSVNDKWLLEINKSWVNSCAEARSLMDSADKLDATLLW